MLCEADHAKSVELHEQITANSEELLQKLGLTYRVVTNCGGDLGLGQVKNMILRHGYHQRIHTEKLILHRIFMISKPEDLISDIGMVIN